MADWKKLLDSAVGQVGAGAKAAGEGLRDATDGLRQVADDARKVAGIGVGEIGISIVLGARIGGKLHGHVTLDLPEPIPAKRLVITLQAWRTRIPIENLRNKQATTLARESVYILAQDIADERTFESGRFPFTFDIPDEPTEIEVDGLLGEAVKAARAFKGLTEGELRWELEAHLEIPWKRNLHKKVRISIGAAKPDESPPPAPPQPDPPKPPPQKKRFVPPPPVSLPAGWGEALDACLAHVRRRGGVVIHQFVPPPADPRAVMAALQRFPDLSPDLLTWYGVMNGLQLIVGMPRAAESEYASIRLAASIAGEYGGALPCGTELSNEPKLEAALRHDFDDVHDLARLEIPPLERLLDTDGGYFAARDGESNILGRVDLGDGRYFGITRAEEIRRWRAPTPNRPARDGYYDRQALPYHVALDRRSRDFDDSWWVLQGEGHGAQLADPPKLLRWTEMLTLCLEHLAAVALR
ncbi:MAG: hypothetical protein AAF721_22995 [Myxococcota bacterium]